MRKQLREGNESNSLFLKYFFTYLDNNETTVSPSLRHVEKIRLEGVAEEVVDVDIIQRAEANSEILKRCVENGMNTRRVRNMVFSFNVT